jgi:RNA polymerase sigma-70 factor (ECF subfamily)
MPTELDFADFLGRIRAGDMQAAADLVRRFEPVVRMEVRLRLRDPRLRRVFDSMDICQSVLASFFVRTAAGQYDLQDSGQLVRLLVSIARNKVAYHARHERAERRDNRRIEPADAGTHDVPGSDPTPSHVVSGRDLLDQVRRRLTAEECRLADLRAQGHGWVEIARALGGTPDARRIQLSRGIERVTRQLGLDEASHA